MNKEKAEAYAAVARSPEGRVVINDIAQDFDSTMKKLLYAGDDELKTLQGHARALHEHLKKFQDAQKTLENT